MNVALSVAPGARPAIGPPLSTMPASGSVSVTLVSVTLPALRTVKA